MRVVGTQGALGLLLGTVGLFSTQQVLRLENIPLLTEEQAEILSHMSIVYLDDGQGGQAKTIRIDGVNVQVVNGLGATETTNGLGNLIVGYQELGNEVDSDVRTGSHYLLVGRRHNYSAYGGILIGESNIGSGSYGSIAGGRRNRTSGPWTSILGGGHNHAAVQGATIVGGDFNYSAGDASVVIGGSGNQAVSPGGGGTANKAVVVGGFDNRAKAQGSVVVGGRYNESTANYSAILAGTNNACVGNTQGGGSYCAIVGGQGNQTGIVTAATVGGGLNRSAVGDHDWAAGSLLEDQ